MTNRDKLARFSQFGDVLLKALQDRAQARFRSKEWRAS
jgi:hypothetical protein